MTQHTPGAPVRAGRQLWWLALVLGALTALLAAAASFGLKHLGDKPVARSGSTESAVLLPAAVVLAQDVTIALTGIAAFQPEAAPSPAALPAVETAATRAAWQIQASQAWDSGAWDHAARLWTEGLRSTVPSTLALQIADLQTLEQAQRLHQVWSREWPVVILPQTSPSGPRWMVLALPSAAELDAAQQRLSKALGQTIAWASVVQWAIKAEAGQTVIAAAAPTAPATPAIKEPKPEKPQPVASAPAPATAATATTALASALPVPPQGPSQATTEPPQVSRSNGASPDDQARAVMATKAIDVDFSAVEQWLAKAEFEKALGAAERLEGYIGPNWRTRYLAGVALSGLGRWNEAVSALTSARQKNPGHARVALHMAVALQETGDHTGAIETLLKAMASHPDMPELWLNQGHSLQAQGLTDEAAQAYRRFLDLSATRNDLSQQRSWVNKRLQRDI